MPSFKTIFVLSLLVGLAIADERKKRQTYDGQYGGAAAYRPQEAYQQQQQQPPQAYDHQQQYAPRQPARRPSRPHANSVEEEEKDEGPHPLTLLLENSKFECGSKADGYYADSDVGCQAFHYCVAGHKHSMMCPAGTVFHQVHLNCVPQDQDICSKSDKFFFVNDYLNRALEQKGPNNTVVYAQRYYPDNYANGDPFIPPQDGRRDPPAATYGLGPAYREQQPAPVQQPQAYRPQPAAVHQPQAYRQQPAHIQPQAPVRHAPPAAVYAQPQPAPVVHRPQPAPYAPPAPQVYQQRPQPARPSAHQQQAQAQLYGYGAQQAQAHQAQALQAQRAHAQQQYQALAPQQQLYDAGAVQRPRYAQQY